MAFDGAHDGVAVLQRIAMDAPLPLRDLYWRGTAEPAPGGGLAMPAGAAVSFQTYFGAFFEQHWRAGTRLRRAGLRLDLQGRVRLRLLRHTQHAGATPVLERMLDGPAHVEAPDDVRHWRQAGMLWFELTALEDSLLRAATWTAPGAVADPVSLGIAICTFNREDELGAVLDAIESAPALDAAVARVVVVNQGRPGLAQHPAVAGTRLGARLRLIEQPNFGGAGGFGRGLLELLDDPAVSHVVFLDDDVRLEAESLARMHAFFGLADRPCALGGHMLDAINPAMLYEAGATIGPDWWMQPIAHMQDLRDPGVLAALLECGPMHYNGWWCFGFPKRLAQEHGLMLPCFIRGDDVEFGLRLGNRGVPTLPLPGVAVWHEPFYLKLGGWQLYYETRNMLVWATLHRGATPTALVRKMLAHLLAHLLTYRYYGAALIVRAIEHWLQGPEILDRDPRPLHEGLAELRARHPEPPTPRTRVLEPAVAGREPRLRTLAKTWAVARDLLRPGTDQAPRLLPVQDLVWHRVAPNRAVAVETHWDEALPTFRHDPAATRGILWAGLRALWSVYRRGGAVQRAWREAAPLLTSEAFWRAYLDRPGPNA